MQIPLYYLLTSNSTFSPVFNLNPIYLNPIYLNPIYLNPIYLNPIYCIVE